MKKLIKLFFGADGYPEKGISTIIFVIVATTTFVHAFTNGVYSLFILFIIGIICFYYYSKSRIKTFISQHYYKFLLSFFSFFILILTPIALIFSSHFINRFTGHDPSNFIYGLEIIQAYFQFVLILLIVYLILIIEALIIAYGFIKLQINEKENSQQSFHQNFINLFGLLLCFFVLTYSFSFETKNKESLIFDTLPKSIFLSIEYYNYEAHDCTLVNKNDFIAELDNGDISIYNESAKDKFKTLSCSD